MSSVLGRNMLRSKKVVGITWYEAMAYCSWLNEQISEGANGEWQILNNWPDAALWEQVKS